MTDAEIAQLLLKRGIQPDIQGRLLNEQNRRQKEDKEQEARGYELLNKTLDTQTKQRAVELKKKEKPSGGTSK